MNTKSLAAIAFLYFASLASVVAFGGAMSALTDGCMGVVEVLASCGMSGMAYAVISGQPMTFLAPTGLTLAFTAALYRYTAAMSAPTPSDSIRLHPIPSDSMRRPSQPSHPAHHHRRTCACTY